MCSDKGLGVAICLYSRTIGYIVDTCIHTNDTIIKQQKHHTSFSVSTVDLNT